MSDPGLRMTGVERQAFANITLDVPRNLALGAAQVDEHTQGAYSCLLLQPCAYRVNGMPCHVNAK